MLMALSLPDRESSACGTGLIQPPHPPPCHRPTPPLCDYLPRDMEPAGLLCPRSHRAGGTPSHVLARGDGGSGVGVATVNIWFREATEVLVVCLYHQILESALPVAGAGRSGGQIVTSKVCSGRCRRCSGLHSHGFLGPTSGSHIMTSVTRVRAGPGAPGSPASLAAAVGSGTQRRSCTPQPTPPRVMPRVGAALRMEAVVASRVMPRVGAGTRIN